MILTKDDITQKLLKDLLHYDPETGIFTWKVWRGGTAKKGTVAGCHDSHGYSMISIYGVRYGAHRIAWLYMTGDWPTDHMDHINRIRDDNRFSNIHVVTQMQNNANMKTNNKFVGVRWHRANKIWMVSLCNRHIGSFLTHFAACYARHAAEQVMIDGQSV